MSSDILPDLESFKDKGEIPELNRKARRKLLKSTNRNLRVQNISLVDGTIKRIFHQKINNLPRIHPGMSKIK